MSTLGAAAAAPTPGNFEALIYRIVETAFCVRWESPFYWLCAAVPLTVKLA